MSGDEKRRLRDEVAELSKAVRELREQLAKRDEHHCHGHWHYTPYSYPATITYPPVTVCSGSGNTMSLPNVYITNSADADMAAAKLSYAITNTGMS